MQILQLERLGRRFGSHWALRGINLTAEEGDLLAVWGGTGAGKTTLLHLLSTLLRPTEGRAWVDGHEVHRHRQLVRSTISLGFQTPTLDPQLTVYEGLDLRATMSRVPQAHRPNRIAQLLQMLGLIETANRPVGTLSATQRRRLEVVAALLPVPRVLLLDEPFAGMDEDMANRLWEHLLEMKRQERSTIVIATSAAIRAERCNRIAVLHEGQLLAYDTPDLIRSAAGKDIVMVKPLDERLTPRRLQERLQVVVTEEEDGFKMEVQRGDSVAAEILGDFGGQTAAIYVRRPSLEAGLRRILDGGVVRPTEEPLLEAGFPFGN